MFKDVLKGMKSKNAPKKWKVWGNKELNKMKKEGSPQKMVKLTKKVF